MPKLGLSLGTSNSIVVPSSPVAGFGFPASINISRSSTSVWNGDGSYYIGHMTNVPVGNIRNFPKIGVFTNNNNVANYFAGGDKTQMGNGDFVNGKHYLLLLSHSNDPWIDYNIYHYLIIGLCSLLQNDDGSETFTLINSLSWVACSIWGDTSAGDGMAGAYIVATNSSTDYNNFPTTGWSPSGVTITAS